MRPGGSLVRRVVGLASAVTGLALALLGAIVAALLVAGAHRALDQSLLAAAHAASAGPEEGGRWGSDEHPSPVSARFAHSGDPLVPAEIAARAVATENPIFRDAGGRRVLVLPLEPMDGDDDDARGHLSALVVAWAPAVSWRSVVAPFAGAYTFGAAITILLASIGQRAILSAALAPVAGAARDVSTVMGLGSGTRVREEGPEEIRALLGAVNALLGRLEAASEAQARFTAEAAHELRTPLTALLGGLDVALRRPRTAEELREILLSSREEVGRLASLVEELLALARVDAGQADRDRDLERASALAHGAARIERDRLAAAGCALLISVEADPEIRVHRALLETALANLLRNAALYAPGAPVHLTVTRRADRVAFVVDDGGPGVDLEAAEALFDRFARGGKARRQHAAGLGLGLPLAREIARRHGGDCGLERSPTGGCRAVLTVGG